MTTCKSQACLCMIFLDYLLICCLGLGLAASHCSCGRARQPGVRLFHDVIGARPLARAARRAVSVSRLPCCGGREGPPKEFSSLPSLSARKDTDQIVSRSPTHCPEAAGEQCTHTHEHTHTHTNTNTPRVEGAQSHKHTPCHHHHPPQPLLLSGAP